MSGRQVWSRAGYSVSISTNENRVRAGVSPDDFVGAKLAVTDSHFESADFGSAASSRVLAWRVIADQLIKHAFGFDGLGAIGLTFPTFSRVFGPSHQRILVQQLTPPARDDIIDRKGISTRLMPEPLPKFDAPPVVEMLLSAQFDKLPGYTTAHAGAFWNSVLRTMPGGDQWTKLKEATRLPEQFEKIGEEEWRTPGFSFGAADEPQRIQIIRFDEQRMVQVQDTRFVLNWRKRSSGYPSFNTINREFPALFDAFKEFVASNDLGEVRVNQWEVTYVNHIKRDLWESPNDWKSIIPAATIPPSMEQIEGETFSVDWRYRIRDRGRLYVGVKHAKVEADEVLQLVLLARGPVSSGKGWTLEQGFELGHEAIVRTFASITSQDAHRHWQRRA